MASPEHPTDRLLHTDYVDWRHAHPLTPEEQILCHEGLLVEIAPGISAPVDLTRSPMSRAGVISPYIPAHSCLHLWTAWWVHTGYRPDERLPLLISTKRSTSALETYLIENLEKTQIGELNILTLESCAGELFACEDFSLALSAYWAYTHDYQLFYCARDIVAHAFENFPRKSPLRAKLKVRVKIMDELLRRNNTKA